MNTTESVTTQTVQAIIAMMRKIADDNNVSTTEMAKRLGFSSVYDWQKHIINTL